MSVLPGVYEELVVNVKIQETLRVSAASLNVLSFRSWLSTYQRRTKKVYTTRVRAGWFYVIRLS